MSKLRLLSASDPANAAMIAALENRMRDFYTNSTAYYADIAFTADCWTNDPVYGWLVERLPAEGPILELGCGEAFILRSHPQLAPRYTGIDHSPDLIARNIQRYPTAKFLTLENSRRSPPPNGTFKAIMAVWVLEHVVRPHEFLDDCVRWLAPGGVLLLLTPNLLGDTGCGADRYGLPNHIYGRSEGDVRTKLRTGRWIDACQTWLDARWRIPSTLAKSRNEALAGRGFFIHTAPSCFSVPFHPDADAVHMCFEPEIRQRLGKNFTFDAVAPELQHGRRILLCARKQS